MFKIESIARSSTTYLGGQAKLNVQILIFGRQPLHCWVWIRWCWCCSHCLKSQHYCLDSSSSQRSKCGNTSFLTAAVSVERVFISCFQVVHRIGQNTSGFFFRRFGGNVGEWTFRKIELWQISWVLAAKMVEFSINFLGFLNNFLEYWSKLAIKACIM